MNEKSKTNMAETLKLVQTLWDKKGYSFKYLIKVLWILQILRIGLIGNSLGVLSILWDLCVLVRIIVCQFENLN